MESDEQILKRYMRERNIDKSKHTLKIDNLVLRTFSRYVKKPFREVTKDDVMDFFDAMRTGKITSQYGRYGGYTIELYKSQIKKFFKWLYDFEITQKVPEQVAWIKLNVKKAYKHKTKADILTLEEIEQFIEAAKTPRNRAIISVLFDSACRISEFTNLSVGDVIQEGNEISVCVDGKTGQRTIPLNNSTKYLLEYLENHPYKQLRTAPLWLSNRKQKLTRRGVYQAVESIAKRSKVQQNVSCHILRHSRLTDLAKKGMNESQMRYFAEEQSFVLQISDLLLTPSF